MWVKDRVGGSRRDLRRAHLNVDISLDIQGTKTYEIYKNSSLLYLFSYKKISFCVSRLILGTGH